MIPCIHQYGTERQTIRVCILCGQKAPCETRVKQTIFGLAKYSRKTHQFHNGRCVGCGLSQFKIEKRSMILVRTK